MNPPVENVRILMLEDAPSDAELEECELQDAQLAFTLLRVDTREAFMAGLDEFKPDLVLADYKLPAYNGREALEYTRRTHPQIPVIMVTGAIGDEAAIELLKLGARDYVLKDRLARLAPAIQRALSEERGIRNRKIAEGKYHALFVEAMDGIVLADCKTACILECNPEFERQTGRTQAQLKSLNLWQLRLPAEQEGARNDFFEVREAGSRRVMALQRPDGSTVPVDFVFKVIRIQDACFIQGVSRDITERLHAEHALRDSEDKFHSITASAQDAILMMDNEGKISYWNAAAEKMFGYAEHEAQGRVLHDLLAPERFLGDFHIGFSHFKDSGEGPVVGKTLELAAMRKDGTEFPIELSLSAIKRDGMWNAIGIVRDITERKLAEVLLRQERDFSEGIVETAQAIILVLSPEGRIVRFNRFMENLTGYSLNEVAGQDWFSTFLPESRCEELRKLFEGAIRDVQTHGYVNAILTRDGRQLLIEWYDKTLMDGQGNLTGLLSIGLNVTERERANALLIRANRALKTLSAVNLALVQAASEDALLHAVANIIVETGGYRLAAVCYAGEGAEKNIRLMAWSGTEENYYWNTPLSLADAALGQMPVACAIRDGAISICRDIAGEGAFPPWQDAALARGYVSNIALPLSDGHAPFGALSIYSSEANAFDEDEVHLLGELAGSLSYGILTLRARIAHEQHAAVLRQSLEQSIQMIADTVEARDPYTAGHQRRVADLASAIAREMGLPDEQIKGIHLAATIHDLGKIHIPAEILSKPSRLAEIEFQLIKTHSQAGYDILKDVKFPWPIAQIVLQHHEKLDGSGYPQGLVDAQILPESKIITVADVVEAMSSHRPYRPGLGVEAALDEITRGRGTLYAPQVVDACVALFSQRGYVFRD